MSTRADLEAICADLAADRALDAGSRCLIIRAIQKLIDQPSRARDQLFRQEALRERDEWLRRLAHKHCRNITSRRAKAHQITTWVTRYQETAWRQDAAAFNCPERIVGTPQEYIWHALSAGAVIPGERRLLDIIS